MTILTREQFIDLSGKLYAAKNWNQETLEFNNETLTIKAAETLLDDYRENDGEITITGKIPDEIGFR